MGGVLHALRGYCILAVVIVSQVTGTAWAQKGHWELRVAAGAAVPLFNFSEFLENTWQAGGGVGCGLGQNVVLSAEVYGSNHDVQDNLIWIYQETVEVTVLKSSVRLTYNFGSNRSGPYIKAGPDVLWTHAKILIEGAPDYYSYHRSDTWVGFGGGAGYRLGISRILGGFVETEMDVWSKLDEGANALLNARAGMSIHLGSS